MLAWEHTAIASLAVAHERVHTALRPVTLIAAAGSAAGQSAGDGNETTRTHKDGAERTKRSKLSAALRKLHPDRDVGKKPDPRSTSANERTSLASARTGLAPNRRRARRRPSAPLRARWRPPPGRDPGDPPRRAHRNRQRLALRGQRARNASRPTTRLLAARAPARPGNRRPRGDQRGAHGNRRDRAFALASPVAMTERGDAHLPAEIQQFVEQLPVAVLATVRRDNSPATARAAGTPCARSTAAVSTRLPALEHAASLGSRSSSCTRAWTPTAGSAKHASPRGCLDV